MSSIRRMPVEEVLLDIVIGEYLFLIFDDMDKYDFFEIIFVDPGEDGFECKYQKVLNNGIWLVYFKNDITETNFSNDGYLSIDINQGGYYKITIIGGRY